MIVVCPAHSILFYKLIPRCCEISREYNLYIIAVFQCLMEGTETVIIIDDAHNIDTASWEYMCELTDVKQAMIVLGLRPSIIEKPSCKKAFQFMEDSNTRLIDLGSLDLKFMAPLACQMMDVVSIPKDLDK